MEELEDVMVSLPYINLVEAVANAILSSVTTEEEAERLVKGCFESLSVDGKDLVLSAAKSEYIIHYGCLPEED